MPDHHSGNTQRHQTKSKCHEPAPILDEFVRDLDFDGLDIAHHVLPPVSVISSRLAILRTLGLLDGKAAVDRIENG